MSKKTYEWTGKVPAITNVKEIIRFLTLVHPELLSDEYSSYATELRTVARDLGAFRRAKLFWGLTTEEDLKAFEKYISNISETPNCAYYSLFNQDTTKKAASNCTNKDNAYAINVLPIDLDDIDESEFSVIEFSLALTGLEYICVFTGHGYQILFLLNEPCTDKTILEKWLHMVLKKGIKADASIIDPARIFRLPYTYNCKGFDKRNKHYGEQAIETYLLKTTDRRYSIEDIFKSFEILGDIEIEIEPTEIKGEHKEDSKDIKPGTKNKTKEVEYKSIENMYPYLKFEELPEPVKLMLRQTDDGIRNEVLLFIVPYLKNFQGLKASQINEIMQIWNKEASKPSQDESFIKDEVYRLCKYKPKYSLKLKQEFGSLNIVDEYKKDNKLNVRGKVFKSYTDLSEGALRIYIVLLIEKHLKNKITFLEKEITEAADISRRTLYNNLGELIELGLVDKKRAYRKAGEEYKYTINGFILADEGFTQFEIGTLDNMLFNKKRSLTAGEMKVYLYLCFMLSGKENCFASQQYIADKTGYNRSSISRITTQLEQKNYISKQTIVEGKKARCIYILKY